MKNTSLVTKSYGIIVSVKRKKEEKKDMYKNEIKKELQAIYNSNKNIDNELVNIKVAIHNLEELGCNIKDLEKCLITLELNFINLKLRIKKY